MPKLTLIFFLYMAQRIGNGLQSAGLACGVLIGEGLMLVLVDRLGGLLRCRPYPFSWCAAAR